MTFGITDLVVDSVQRRYKGGPKMIGENKEFGLCSKDTKEFGKCCERGKFNKKHYPVKLH